MQARIFQEPKNAMQSGRARTSGWVLEFAPSEARLADPLMGWSGSGDTQRQVRLSFADADAARAYADKYASMPMWCRPRCVYSSCRLTRIIFVSHRPIVSAHVERSRDTVGQD